MIAIRSTEFCFNAYVYSQAKLYLHWDRDYPGDTHQSRICSQWIPAVRVWQRASPDTHPASKDYKCQCSGISVNIFLLIKCWIHEQHASTSSIFFDRLLRFWTTWWPIMWPRSTKTHLWSSLSSFNCCVKPNLRVLRPSGLSTKLSLTTGKCNLELRKSHFYNLDTSWYFLTNISIFQALDPECCPCHRYTLCTDVRQGEVLRWWADCCWSLSSSSGICAHGDSWLRSCQDCWGTSTSQSTVSATIWDLWHITKSFLSPLLRVWLWTQNFKNTHYCIRL